MKQLISSIIFFFSLNVNAQKIIFDKKDPFTNERQLVTSNYTITPILQVGAMAHLRDTSKVFFLSFIVPGIPGMKADNSDSIVKECKLKLSDGKTISGKYFGNIQAPIGSKFYNSWTYTFTEFDFKMLSDVEITDIKTNQGLFEINPKDRGKISKLCSLLVSK